MNLIRKQRGLSLIELMIAITLGLIVLAALLTVFSQNNKSFRQNDASAQMQDNARFALDALVRDLSMAGYYGGMYGAANIVSLSTAPSNDCGSVDTTVTPNIPWAFRVTRRVEFRNHTSTTSVASAFPCLDSSQPVVANTDIVAIRRVAGQSTADIDITSANALTAKLRRNNFYLKTNGTAGSVIHPGSNNYTINTTGESPLQAPVSFWKYVPRVYFIRNYSQTAGDGIPTLCRMELQHTSGRGSMAAECLADGIENMQIEWGLDVDNDCVVDTYTSNPDSVALALTAITARISLLVRTITPDVGYRDAKTFSIGDFSTTAATNDAFHRRVYSTTVQLRNPVGDNGPCTGPAAP